MEEGNVTQLPWWLIILLLGLVRLQVFQFAVKLAKLFERKCKLVGCLDFMAYERL